MIFLLARLPLVTLGKIVHLVLNYKTQATSTNLPGYRVLRHGFLSLTFYSAFSIILYMLAAVLLTSCCGGFMNHNLSDTGIIKTHLLKVAVTEKSRNYLNTETLDTVATYIKSVFEEHCDVAEYQEFMVNDRNYKNVIGTAGINNKKRIIVGAHYDVCGDQQGADDNASGVVALLELARLFARDTLDFRIDFVAFCLEEPPFFRTNKMGSYIHAKHLFDNKVPVEGMVCLEMLGYFSDEKGSQSYPLGFLKYFYGDKGNFIAVVQKFGNGRFGRRFIRLMKENRELPTKSLTAPAFITGIDYSDHMNYWKFGYSAVMVTNTAFYRNNNYHKETDKIETLDVARMAKVIDEIYFAIKNYKVK